MTVEHQSKYVLRLRRNVINLNKITQCSVASLPTSYRYIWKPELIILLKDNINIVYWMSRHCITMIINIFFVKYPLVFPNSISTKICLDSNLRRNESQMWQYENPEKNIRSKYFTAFGGWVRSLNGKSKYLGLVFFLWR